MKKRLPATDRNATSIRCPACASEIAADGKTLLKRSEELEELQDFGREFKKLSELVPKLEKALADTKAALEEEKKKNVAVPGQTGATGTGATGEVAKPKRKRDWGW